MAPVKTNYTCSYCSKGFVTETRFLKHQCKQMLREQEFNTPIGQAAWTYYKEWLRGYNKFVPSSDAFIHSRYFTTFVQFAKFFKSVQLPDYKLFIKFMRDKQWPPSLWTKPEVYTQFVEHFDQRISPFKHVEITLDTLYKISEAINVDISEVFNFLLPSEISTLIQQRRLSPWFLLNSTKFKLFFNNIQNNEQRDAIIRVIRTDFWHSQFINQPDIVNKIQKIIEVAGL